MLFHNQFKLLSELDDSFIEGKHYPSCLKSAFENRKMHKRDTSLIEVNAAPHACIVYDNDEIWDILKNIPTPNNIRGVYEANLSRAIREEYLVYTPDKQIHTKIIEYPKDKIFPRFIPRIGIQQIGPTQVTDLVRMVDLFVGIPWILLDRDPLTDQRLKFMTPAGMYRLETIESQAGEYVYRDGNYQFNSRTTKEEVLCLELFGATSLVSPWLSWFTMGAIRSAYRALQDKDTITKIENCVNWFDVHKAINTNDLCLAVSVWNGFRDLLSTLYPYAGNTWSDKLRTRLFEHIVATGGYLQYLKDFGENWHLNLDSIVAHGQTLVPWEKFVSKFANEIQNQKEKLLTAEKIEKSAKNVLSLI